MKKIPQWNDEAGVFELVEDEFLEWERQDAEEYALRDWDGYSRAISEILSPEFLRAREREAVAEAERGNVAPLAKLVRLRETPLAPETRAIIAEFLTGARNFGNGRLKGERGRPKMTAEERRAMNPVHDAADEFPMIKQILDEKYPEQSPSDRRDRAQALAAERRGVRVKIENYLARPKRNRRRV